MSKFKEDDIVVVVKITGVGFEDAKDEGVQKSEYMKMLNCIGAIYIIHKKDARYPDRYGIDFRQDVEHVELFYDEELRHATKKEKFLFITTNDLNCLRYK